MRIPGSQRRTTALQLILFGAICALLVLLLSADACAAPPERPTEVAPLRTDCPEVIGVDPGAPLPDWLSPTAKCSAVVFPASQAVAARGWKDYALSLEEYHHVEAARSDEKIRMLRTQRWYFVAGMGAALTTMYVGSLLVGG